MEFNITWPNSKKFAFTIVDDPDCQTVENGKPVYDFLNDLGIKTTKLVWPSMGYKPPDGYEEDSDYQEWIGETCADNRYLAWVKELETNSYEIGLHNITFHTSTREEIIKGLNQFVEHFKHTPSVLASHMGNIENLYWYDQRLSSLNRLFYNLLTHYKTKNKSQGHVESSQYFWGDLCKINIKFMRNFVFNNINTLKECPHMPYHDPLRPFINYWFASSEASSINSFLNLLSESNQDKLEDEGGLCIVYTHLGKGFAEDQNLNQRFKELMIRLSKKNGWFVPASTLLDYLLSVKGHHVLTDKQRNYLERKWLIEKIFAGETS